MIRISASRLDLETNRVDRAQFKNYTETIVTVAAATTTTLDMSSGNIFALSQDTNITVLAISNVPTVSPAATSITIIRTKDATNTPRTIIWPANFVWMSGGVPSLTQAASVVDIIVAHTKDAGVTWYAFAAGLNVS